ncbi:EmrA/EmrK family multidrug efflux transporter periplasmic adaptor subunit [Pasteurellaceae bacterium TAE3-ERU1]|nr:EmrA/EmrK family multidrug efflux transporter periplasmic adaptor subunit [Pasteurellaceae bacterium TAE3-ERU1]
MSNTPTVPEQAPNAQPGKTKTSKSRKRKKALSIFVLVLIVIAIASFAYWFFFLKGYEETEDAYVNGNQVMVSAQVPGNIASINYENTDYVAAGDVLLTLDDTNAKLAFEQAKANLASAVRQIGQLRFQVSQLKSMVEAKQIAYNQAQADLDRRVALGKSGAIAKEALQHAKDNATAARAGLKAAQDQLAATKALLGESDLPSQPSVQQAAVALRKAWLDLQRTQVVAPVSGHVARRSAQVGAMAAVGTPLMAIIPTKEVWVDANFKETQLKEMRVGQSVKLYFDMYGDIEFDGRVVGIEPGTGSAFSLLPAQNATGNWIKVVQRVPVRIALEPEQLEKHPLRIGLSAKVEVHTAEREGDNLAAVSSGEPLFATDTLNYNQQEADALIQRIIRDNAQQ